MRSVRSSGPRFAGRRFTVPGEVSAAHRGPRAPGSEVSSNAFAVVETIELRRLLSASVVNGVLTVVGTPNNDNYQIYYNTATVKFVVINNGVSEGSFALTAFTSASIMTGDGNDVVYTSSLPATTIDSGDGDDTITGSDKNVTVSAGIGDDRITTGKGTDLIDCGAGNDTVVDAGNGNDTVYGGAGNDEIHAGGNNDVVNGNEDNDALYGDAGNDTVNGDDGDDFLAWSLGSDQMFGNAGLDTYDCGNTANGYNVRLSLDDLANDTYSLNADSDNVHSDFEVLNGGGGNDTLIGSSHDDVINGAGGNDSIRGGAGDDDLTGGAGNDSLFGEDGNDTVHTFDLLGFDYADGGSGTNTAADFDLLFDTLVNF